MVLSLLQTLLFWLQSGLARLGTVHAHREEVREVAVQLSSSLVALSWLLCKPKALKKKRKGEGAVLGRLGATASSLSTDTHPLFSPATLPPHPPPSPLAL